MSRGRDEKTGKFVSLTAAARAEREVHALAAARRSLRVFSGLIGRTIEGKATIPPRHLADIVIPALMDDSLGHTVIVAPPESAKTTQLIANTAFQLGRNPQLHVAFISNTAAQGYKRSVAVRDLIQLDPRYHAIFPEATPDLRKGWSQDEWYLQRENPTDKDASLVAGGVGAPILGNRIDLGVLDDIADKDNMATPLQREKVMDWLERIFMTRLTPRARCIMIATRWHASDPVDWAKRQGWHCITIPAITEEGESYWPEHWPLYKLSCQGEHGQPRCYVDPVTGAPGNCKRRVLGTKKFNQQYLGSVFDDETAILKRHWWRYYSVADTPLGLGRTGTFVDMAHGEGKENDYSVILTAVSDGVNLYIREVQRLKVEFPELIKAVRAERERWGYPIYIERTPGSMPLIQQLRRSVPGVIPWEIEGRSKVERAHASSPFLEAGNVYLPSGSEGAPHPRWVDEFVEEAVAFPTGANDDQVDAFTMSVLTLLRPTIRLGPVGAKKKIPQGVDIPALTP